MTRKVSGQPPKTVSGRKIEENRLTTWQLMKSFTPYLWPADLGVRARVVGSLGLLVGSKVSENGENLLIWRAFKCPDSHLLQTSDR